MTRRSIAAKILEGLPEQDILNQEYLICYDFVGGRPNPTFYKNIHRISWLTGSGGNLTQYSVYRTKSLKAAIAVHELCIRYGAMVQLYEVNETSPEQLLEKIDKAQIEEEES